MIDAISSALSGLHNATARFNRASQTLIESTSGVSNADPATAIVDSIQAKAEFQASAFTLKTADEMQRSLLDIVV